MTWNHRIMRTTDPDGTFVYAIHEVHYDDRGAIEAWTENAVHPMGETLNELHREVMMFQRAFARHILDVRGEELYDIGLTGRTRNAPSCVYRRLDSVQPDEALVGPAPVCEPQPQEEEKKDVVSRLPELGSSGGRQHANPATGDK